MPRPTNPNSAAGLKREIAVLRAQTMCSMCAGDTESDASDCVCGGARTAEAEIDGLEGCIRLLRAQLATELRSRTGRMLITRLL
jgi:hypothetical protein